ncbi:hypothetical protein Gotri_002784 [Gossypium trilobum]|uniref:Putative plant transposon protein domain-containing protein n=1 Tax=Gossypium trilobum TaxID=34281 RepID=A0A7J9F9B5_9ROSI|nr:hypothetical protein [Gossypium trilobum]
MGFEQLMILCQEILPLVRYYRQECFYVIPKDSVVVPVVQEFYASLKDQESRRLEGTTWETISIQGKKVRATHLTICEFYNAPYIEKDFVDEGKGKGEWKCHPSTEIPTSFNQAIMFLVAKMWIQFLCRQIALALNISNVNTFRAILLYAILQRKHVYIGTWIYNYMKRCVSGQKVRIFFPHLVTTLYKRACVPMEKFEQSMKPSRSIIGDTLYTQYMELRQKQIIYWNKCQKEKMDVPKSSPKKEKLIARQEIGEKNHPKLD